MQRVYIYARILDNRVRCTTEAKVLEEQGEFRKKRSCVDQLFTVRQLGEQVIKKNKRKVMVCVGLKKAYDKIHRELLWPVLNSYGVGVRLGRAVRSLYERCQACVKVLRQNSDWFVVEQGVRQGCVLPPWLFNLYMDTIVREAREMFVEGVKLEETTVELCRGDSFNSNQMIHNRSLLTLRPHAVAFIRVQRNKRRKTKVLTVKKRRQGNTWGHCLMEKARVKKRLKAGLGLH